MATWFYLIIFQTRFLNVIQLICDRAHKYLWICPFKQQTRVTLKIHSYWEPRMSSPLRTTGHSTDTHVHETPSVGIRYCRRTVLGPPPHTRFPPSFRSVVVGGTRRTPLLTKTEADNMVHFMKMYIYVYIYGILYIIWHTPKIPESLAWFQVLHERHVTLESQFGGIAQLWAAAHQDIIPTKSQKAIRKRGKKWWKLRMLFYHTCRSLSPLRCIWTKHRWPNYRLDCQRRKTLGESLCHAFQHCNMYPKDTRNHM